MNFRKQLKIAAVVLFFISITGVIKGQEEIASFQFGLETFAPDEKTYTYPVYNEESGEVRLYMFSTDEIWEGTFNQNGEKIKSSVKKVSTVDFPNMLEYRETKKAVTFLFANEGFGRFLQVEKNLKTEEWTSNEVSIIPLSEKFVVSAMFEDVFYVFVVKNGTSEMIAYRVKGNEFVKQKDFNFSKGKYGEDVTLSDLLSVKKDKKNKLRKVNSKFVTPLMIAAKKNKAYQDNEKLIITLDNVDLMGTHILNVDMKNWTSGIDFIASEDVICENPVVEGNEVSSFLAGNILGQIKACDVALRITFFDLSNGNQKLNSYYATKDSILKFKNFDNILNVPEHQKNAVSVMKVASTMLMRKMVTPKYFAGISMYEKEGVVWTYVGSTRKHDIRKGGGRRSGGGGNGNGGGRGGGGGGNGDGGGNGAGGGNGRGGAPTEPVKIVNGSTEFLYFEKEKKSKPTYILSAFDKKNNMSFLSKEKASLPVYSLVAEYELNNSYHPKKGIVTMARTLVKTKEGYWYGALNPENNTYKWLMFSEGK